MVYGMLMIIEIFCFLCLWILFWDFFGGSIIERIFSLLIPSLLMFIIAFVFFSTIASCLPFPGNISEYQFIDMCIYGIL